MENLRIFFYALLALFFLHACGGGSSSKQESADGQVYETLEESAVEESEASDMASPSMQRKSEKTAAPAPEPNDPDAPPTPKTEEYEEIKENPFSTAKENPITTFSIDVDNASYSNIRRYIQGNELPVAGAVRIEEMINYFSYDYPDAKGNQPFSITTEVATCPWNTEHQLVHIGLQGKKLNYQDLKPSNLVFLIDASGSMSDANKLPLLKKSLGMLLDQLGAQDRIAIVAYAGAAGLILPSTPAKQKQKILNALNQLEAGGSTAGGEGIELAYTVAKQNLIKEGNNRVILATDGDFNVGISDDEALVKLIEEKRKDGIYLTICGFGMGNYKDRKMEMISNAGNGNYFYIDNIREAQKVFVTEMRANMFTIAKDVKIQVVFNPSEVKAYRLIGYENRRLQNQDFDDDTKDAGELGAGHTVTAIYEIIPINSKSTQTLSTESVMGKAGADAKAITFAAGELMGLRLRYKPIQSDNSLLMEQKLMKKEQSFEKSSQNFRFSAAVAGFGLLLRDSQYKGNLNYTQVEKIAKGALGKDTEGHRAEFVQLVKQAALLSQTAKR